jgi:long-chain acyl-CoA synthetase
MTLRLSFSIILTCAEAQQKAFIVDKVWISHYQEGVPKTINTTEFQTLTELFNNACDKFPKNTAFKHLNSPLSYKDLHKKACQFAAYLQYLGLKKGDRLAIMLPNMMQYPIAMFGSFLLGVVVVNTNPLYTANEISHQLKDAGVKAILVLENFAHTLESALPNLPELKHIILTNVGDVFPFVKRLAVNGFIKYIKKMIPFFRLENTISWKDTQNHSHALTPADVDASDLAYIQYTGGTTGISKGAMLSHGNMASNVKQCSIWIKPAGFGENDRIVTALPLYHVFSLTANLLTFFHFGAENLLITNPNDVKSFIKQISKYKLTAFTGVNTLFNVLLHHRNFSKVDFSELKLSLSGGMALQASVAKKWHQVTGTPILEAYGLTETSPGICINPMYVKKFNGSVGLPLPSTDISLRDDNGIEMPIGQAGELCVKGPQVMRGYWQKPQESKDAFWKDGYFKTGDIAVIREDSFVYLVDRKKDMILVSGFNVYPNEVEQIIGMLPGVLEVGVIGVKIDDNIEKVKACVVKTDPHLTSEDIRQHCKQYLTGYKVPKIIEFYDSLPKSNVGKILRRSLH